MKHIYSLCSQILSVFIMSIALIALLGYVVGHERVMAGWGISPTMAVPTASTFILVALNLILISLTRNNCKNTP